jgi:hypothetical protein
MDSSSSTTTIFFSSISKTSFQWLTSIFYAKLLKAAVSPEYQARRAIESVSGKDNLHGRQERLQGQPACGGGE